MSRLPDFKNFILFFRSYGFFENLGILNFKQQDISETIRARGLKLAQLIGDDE